MAYTRTVAFNTGPTARHGGDPGWIRHANGRLVSDVRTGDLRGVEAVGTAANTAQTVTQVANLLASLGTTFAQLRQNKMDGKAAKNDAAGQEREAAAAQAENATLVAAQAAAQSAALEKAATDASPAGGKKSRGGLTPTTLEIGGGVAILGVIALIFFLRRK